MSAMDGNSQTLFLLRARSGQRAESALVIASIVFAIAIGSFLVWRCAVGAIDTPIPAVGLVATALGLTVWAIVVRAVAATLPIGRLWTWRQAAGWAVLGVVVLFAVGCSYPGARILDWLVWLSAGAVVFAAPAVMHMKKESLLKRNSAKTDGSASDEKILQQYSRVRSAEGQDTISGTLVAEFAVGERQVTVYAGFCPPFELLPEVEVYVADDFDAEVKLIQVLHNGAQIEVRLSEPAEEPASVVIEFVAAENA
jgi:hypothetical protein